MGLFLWTAPSFASDLMLALRLDVVPHDDFLPDDVRQLGNQIMGGGIVAVAILIAEVFVNRRIQQGVEQRQEQENLRNMLAFREDLSDIDLRGRNLQLAPIGE